MQETAEETRHLPDAKTRRLIDWVRKNLCPELPPFGKQPAGAPPKWNNRRVLIFTENREGTKRIDPDYRLHVSERLLGQHDGSMLEALKKLNGGTLNLPARAKD